MFPEDDHTVQHLSDVTDTSERSSVPPTPHSIRCQIARSLMFLLHCVATEWKESLLLLKILTFCWVSTEPVFDVFDRSSPWLKKIIDNFLLPVNLLTHTCMMLLVFFASFKWIHVFCQHFQPITFVLSEKQTLS